MFARDKTHKESRSFGKRAPQRVVRHETAERKQQGLRTTQLRKGELKAKNKTEEARRVEQTRSCAIETEEKRAREKYLDYDRCWNAILQQFIHAAARL